MKELTITIDGTPAPQGSHVATVDRRGKTHIRDSNKNLKQWRDIMTWNARKHAGTFDKEEPLAVSYIFIIPKGKTVRRQVPAVYPDLDKLIRAAGDSMTAAGVWADDGQVVKLERTYKVYETPTSKPGVFIHIREITPEELTELAGK